MLYALIAFAATLFGAVTGMGGGVFIKPILDFWWRQDAVSISFMSSATVFAMSGVTLLKSRNAAERPDSGVAVPLSISAGLGGVLGERLFTALAGNVSAVAARRPQTMWRFIEEESIRHIQFIPCLDSLSPRMFYSFYSGIFPLWKRRAKSGGYISVKLFEDIYDLFVLGRAEACGINGQCFPQYLVEADGSVFPCDFYALDAYKVGNLTEITPRQVFESEISRSFRAERGDLLEICRRCCYKAACGGGCKRQRPAMCVDDFGFCGFRALLDDLMSDDYFTWRKSV